MCTILLTRCEKDNYLPNDGDGNEYDTVVIGTQVWLAENLKTTKYNNGVSIPLVTDNTEWASKTTAAFCWYNNDPTYKDSYGALYNWYSVNAKLLCPIGWHVSTDEDWTTLINYLGGEDVAGAKLKETGTEHWNYPNNCATNETGFEARAGGSRSPNDGSFWGLRSVGSWWVYFPGLENGLRIDLYVDICAIFKKGLSNKTGYSVRCVKNN